jgi:hypothetical protein
MTCTPVNSFSLFLAALCLTLGACASIPHHDPPGQIARLFCDLYLEDADLMAALPFVTGQARLRILDEMSRLPAGATAAPRPVLQATIVQEHREPDAGRVSYLAEVIVPPPPVAAAGSPSRRVAFTLVVIQFRDLPGAPWRVNFFHEG